MYHNCKNDSLTYDRIIEIKNNTKLYNKLWYIVNNSCYYIAVNDIGRKIKQQNL